MKRYGVALNSVVNAKRISLDELNSVKDKGMTLKQLSEYFCMSTSQMIREIKRHGMYIKQPNRGPFNLPYQLMENN